MSKITYWYADSGGNIRENKEILPLRSLSDNDGMIFRFAFDQESNKFYIQDSKFKQKMARGDEKAWYFVNESLKFVSDKFGGNFPEREYGDPPGTSKKRRLSDYGPAWKYLTKFLEEELSTTPLDMTICEFVPSPGDNPMPVSLELPGITCEGQRLNEPCIKLNRHAHKDERTGATNEDVDPSLLEDLLVSFYLRNMAQIAHASGGDIGRNVENRLADHCSDMGYRLMFASSQDGNVKIFKANDDDMDEAKIRENGLSQADHVVMFSYSPERTQIIFHNYTPMDMVKEPSLRGVLEEIKKLASRASGKDEKSMLLTFDPRLCSPYVSKLSRYRIPWTLGEGEVDDITVVELPIPVDAGASIVRSAKEENAKSPGARRYRVRHGVDASYPFMLVDNRTHNLGTKYRAMLSAAKGKASEVRPSLTQWIKNDQEFLKHIRSPKGGETAAKMRFMLRMGMPRQHILDFFAPRGAFLKRAEYDNILADAWRDFETRLANKTAAIGPSYDVNSWWHRGLQEELNRAQHDEQPKRRGAEPFNMRNMRKKPGEKKKSHESLLNDQRDKELGYMKLTEQLLRESNT